MKSSLLAIAAAVAAAGCGSFVEGFREGYNDARVDRFSVETGECLKEDPSVGAAGTIDSIDVVDCDEEHFAEAYSVTQMVGEDDAFPGDDAIIAAADSQCLTNFESFVGVPYQESELDVLQLYPVEQSWSIGDRDIACLVFDPGGQTTGSLESAGR